LEGRVGRKRSRRLDSRIGGRSFGELLLCTDLRVSATGEPNQPEDQSGE